MTGILVYVMGPSGAGKDSLLEYARQKMAPASAQPVIFMQRFITRPADPNGERHCPLSREEFRVRQAAGFFALCWESHGLSYGIGRELDDILASGASAVVSGSRLYLPEARGRYPKLVPVLITARADILRSRLEKRGREDAGGIEERLAAAAARELQSEPGLITVDNSGSLATAQRHFLKILQRLIAAHAAAELPKQQEAVLEATWYKRRPQRGNVLYYAHSLKGRPTPDWQPLQEHLRAVAERAEQSARPFQSQAAAYLCGLLHDLGKYSDAFQKRLAGGKRVDHSLAGALEACARLPGACGKIFAHIVSAHHTGLANGCNTEDTPESSGQTLCERLAGAAFIPEYAAWTKEISLPDTLSAQQLFPPGMLGLSRQQLPFALYFWCKMVFSCLVDADFLDTEQAVAPEKHSLRQGYPSLAQLHDALDTALLGKSQNAPASPLNMRRNEILAACRKAANLDPGCFSLTVPTGGGKTLSSLAFALQHARRHALERVIYVIPYTSIIEQTAEVFRAAFGPLLAHAVVEHHCNVQEEQEIKNAEIADEAGNPRTLAWENWDAPIIVTTSVQFYESIFAARTSSCRKLHNIANSVVILDEAQTLPLRYLRPCLAALHELVSRYKTSVVLCTATQPKVEKTPWLREGLTNVREIMDNPGELFGALKRVLIHNTGKLSDEELAAGLARHERALCIVNTRKHARSLCERLMARQSAVFHLSTWMYPAHRRKTLAEIRRRLDGKLPCLVIATSLIEAGVDISFPVVYRAVSGADSIAQAAGRCNREQEDPFGQVYVFEPEEKTQGEQDRRIKSGKKALEAHADILLPEAVTAYFEALYSLEGASGLDGKNLLSSIAKTAEEGYFPFRSVANSFSLIEEQTRPVLVAVDDEARQAVEKLKTGYPNREEARRLQQWAVALRLREWNALRVAGSIEAYGLGDAWFVLANNDLYDPVFGLDIRDPTTMKSSSCIV